MTVLQLAGFSRMRIWWGVVLCASVCMIFSPKTLKSAPKYQYNKPRVAGIALIAAGDFDQAIEHFQSLSSEYQEEFTPFHQDYPEDLESYFGLSIAYAHKGEMDKALEYVDQALAAGLPPERYLAGPRFLLQPLYENSEFQQRLQGYDIELLHGPMLSDMTGERAEFWVRTASEVPVKVRVAKTEAMEDIVATGQNRTAGEEDFTAVIQVNDLKPMTEYYYQLEVNRKLLTKVYAFRTFPQKSDPATFTIGFGGGAGYTPWQEYMWETIASHDPLAFFQLGDNVYIDHPQYPAAQRYAYYRRQSRPEYRALTAQTGIFAIWDDHDFGDNDSWGGPSPAQPQWKVPVWETFKNNWNNPYYGGGEEYPGCWFDMSIGDVDFFFLDGRYYRENPETPYPSMLGDRQKQWLLHQLETSDATFKVIVSPVPWGYGAKLGSDDPWQGFKQEREAIFGFIEEHRIPGVILLSADRHRSDIWKYNREPAYPLYEFSSSKLTNVHTHDIIPGSLFGYNEKCSFGQLEFDTKSTDPSVTYKIYSIDDELIYSHTVKLSELNRFD